MDDLGAKWSTLFSGNLNKNVYIYIYTFVPDEMCSFIPNQQKQCWRSSHIDEQSEQSRIIVTVWIWNFS